ncbi:MAG: lysophospholipid acyltransferase family protein [Defluviicoccus sp.]|nr:lysophospholipid acyltransferase family protein [Defluviicoccus sp.]
MVGRIAVLIVALVVLVPLYMLSVGPARRLRLAQQFFFCRVMLWLTGLSVRVLGRPSTEGPVLYASNHVSYLDIPVLNALLDASFISKAEVKGWPLIGFIGRLTGTVFIRRHAAGAKRQRDEIADRLAQGDSLILFPEGTSTNGAGVAPFRSSLFGVIDQAEASAHLLIQPVSVTYTRCADGTPLEGPARELYAWFDDAVLLPHFKRVLGMRGAEVVVTFHEPLRAADHTDRKHVTQLVRNAVIAGVAAAQAEAGLRDGLAASADLSAALPAASAAERR